MNTKQRFDRLRDFIAQGRIVQGKWGDGVQTACLLFALAPEITSNGYIANCPANLIPSWLANLTPMIDDKTSKSAWSGIIRRYADTVQRGATDLDQLGWERVLARFMASILREIVQYDATGECEKVIGMWMATLEGNGPTLSTWSDKSEFVRRPLNSHVIHVSIMWALSASANVAFKTPYAVTAAALAVASTVGIVEQAGIEINQDLSAMPASVHISVSGRKKYLASETKTWDRMSEALFQAIETECNALMETQP